MKKMEIKKILVPVDFTDTSETAIREAVHLARGLKASIYLIHVIEAYSALSSGMLYGQTIVPSAIELEGAVKKQMEEVRGRIKSQMGTLPKMIIAKGSVYAEIISYAKKEKIDLVMMGTHGAAGYKELFIGSNAQRVVTLSEIPVLTIQEKSQREGFGNILIPIDDSLHSREKLNMAMIIAKANKATIHLVGLSPSKSKTELDKFRIKLESVEKIIRAAKLSYETTVVNGTSLAKVAMKYATQQNCDLIVVNTGHESKVGGIFMGAFAQQIVNHSKIPVLSFKHTADHTYIDAPGFGIS